MGKYYLFVFFIVLIACGNTDTRSTQVTSKNRTNSENAVENLPSARENWLPPASVQLNPGENNNGERQRTNNLPERNIFPDNRIFTFKNRILTYNGISYHINEKIVYKTRIKWIIKKTEEAENRLHLTKGSLIPFVMGQSLVFVEQYIKGTSNITYFFVHPDETTAYMGLKKHIDKHGGRAFLFLGEAPAFEKRIRYLIYRVRRFPFGLDPNRIYTDKISLRAEFLKLGYMRNFWANNVWYWNMYQGKIKEAVGKLSGFYKVLAEVSPDPIIGVHDNPGNLWWAKDIFAGKNSSKIAEKWYKKSGTWSADFIYVIRNADFLYFRSIGVNVILQNNRSVPDDGSMSVYFARKKRWYMCLEVGRTGLGTRLAQAVILLEKIRNYTLLPGRIAENRVPAASE